MCGLSYNESRSNGQVVLLLRSNIVSVGAMDSMLISLDRVGDLRAVWLDPEFSTGFSVGEQYEIYAKPEFFR